MTTTTNDLLRGRRETRSWRAIHLPLSLTWTTIALGLIVIVAAVLRLYNLQSVGNANEYYTAAVKSMLQSFHNFFFVAAEPGGSVTIDKPPLGLWLQAFSAMIFGVNGVAVVLPQVIAGILSVPLLFSLVRRYFGSTAGLIAAFALAVTPVSIAVERNNTMDATLIFTLLLAAWAFIRATDTRKVRYLVLGGILVGLGFNIKMMEAFLPLPAFYALYLFGANDKLKSKIVHLILTTLVLIVVSFSWATVVEFTPASQRPYIGSTQNNSIFELIFDYNGLNRLTGQSAPGAANGGANPAQNGTLPALPPGANQFQPPAGLPGGSQGGPKGGAGGGFNIGTAGVLRLVTSPLANEVGWLLPFGIVSLGLLVVSTRLKFPLDQKHQAVILWGGWLLTTAAFFSIAGFFHPYYLATLAPPLAALVGIGAVRLWEITRKHSLLTSLFLIIICGATLFFQIYTASQYMTNLWWVIPAAVVFLIGGIMLIARRKLPRYATLGFVLVFVAMLWIPTSWSAMTTLYANASSTLPEAYSGTANAMQFGPANFGGDGRNRTDGTQAGQLPPMAGSQSSTDTQLLNYLEANTQDTEYLVAVSSSMQGAPLVLATGRPVLYMGGFSGSDPVVNATTLAQLVSEHKLRYVLEGGGGMPGSTKSDVSTYLQSTCKAVNYSSSTTTGNNVTGGFGPGFQATTLYDCSVS